MSDTFQRDVFTPDVFGQTVLGDTSTPAPAPKAPAQPVWAQTSMHVLTVNQQKRAWAAWLQGPLTQNALEALLVAEGVRAGEVADIFATRMLQVARAQGIVIYDRNRRVWELTA
jgi:predicted Zn-dependent peptidase